jgi:nucleoside-triphosphatase THEP1
VIDKETGVPILGGKVNDKVMPIDPKVLGDLKKADDEVKEVRADAQRIGYQLVLLLGSVTMIAPIAAEREKAYGEMVMKIANIHGVNIKQIKDIDMEKGLIVLK